MANSTAECRSEESSFTEQLRQRLALFPAPSRYLVGFSGGADSTALLVAMLELRQELAADIHAVHFNHGLQPDANSWQEHCLAFCSRNKIRLHIHKLELNVAAGKSPEEEARQKRYKKVEQLLGDGEIYLTAHHADDNAETFFLNLMRGSGVDGLAAIPPLRRIGRGWVARPLLDFRRKNLEEFLRARRISWLEDPSNQDLAFDRNYVRNQLLPDLDKRWPGVWKRLNQAAVHARDFANVLNTLLAERHGNLLQDRYTLALDPFLGLDSELQALLLRQWLRDQDIVSPPRSRLQEFLVQLNYSTRKGARPELRWAQWQIKRHGNMLWVHEYPFAAVCPNRTWTAGMELSLGPDFGTLSLSGNTTIIPEGWTVGPLKKAAGLRLHEGGPRHRLKELLREQGVPTWLRAAIPVLYWQGEAAAVGNWLFSDELQRWLLQNRVTYMWRPDHPLLCKLQSVSVQFLDERNH